MVNPDGTLTEVERLNLERLQIEDRVHIRAALHHNKKVYESCDGDEHPIDAAALKLIDGHSAAEDSERYIWIMDQQWGDWTGNYRHGKAESEPT